MKTKMIIAALLLCLCFGLDMLQAEDPYQIAWIRQPGLGSYDESNSVAVDNLGNVFISGYITDNFGNPSWADAFLTKYSSSGNLLWTRQLATVHYNWSFSVAVDGYGNTYISGDTNDSLGGPDGRNSDTFLAKYNPEGNLLWTKQLGTTTVDYSWSVAVDISGNAYISGDTSGNLGGTNAGSEDAFLAKYNPDGNLLWTRQLGTSGWDRSYSVVVDTSGNAYISGNTDGNLGGTSAGIDDAFLAKYDPSGNRLWAKQLGTTTHDNSRSVAVDNFGNAYISGSTMGDLGGTNTGNFDAYLAKYDTTGKLLWTEQLGTNADDYSNSIVVDSFGNIYISGETRGTLGGASAGESDAFLAKYNSDGTLLWTEQIGSSTYDRSYAVAADDLGGLYITGCTYGNLGGLNAGSGDAFLMKFVVPEPATSVLMLVAGVFLTRRRR